MRNKYTKEDIEKAVISSKSWAEVCRKLGVKPMTGSQSYLQKRAKEMGISSSHFTGQGWRKGKCFPKKKAIDFCKKDSTIPSHRLKLKLIRDGIKKEECEKCNLSEWMGEKIVLELDHINSDHYDNRLENLQILCPNCHALETRKRREAAGKVDNSVLETEAK